MTQKNEFEQSIRDLAKKDVIPRIADALNKRLEEKLEQLDNSDKLVAFLGNLGNFHEDLSNGIIYSPYRTISDNGKGYVAKSSLRLNETSDRKVVEYRREYETFGEAIGDFIDQTDLTLHEFCNSVGISSATLAKIRKGYTPSKTVQGGHLSPDAIKQRVLSVFDIQPSEKREALQEMPLYFDKP